MADPNAMITVTRGADVEHLLSRFEVTIEEGDGATRHLVTVSSADYERLGTRYGTPERFVHACFEFLLAREPKGSILPEFDVTEIGAYFPEFERTILRG